MRQTIRLKESELRRIITESVARILSENEFKGMFGYSMRNGATIDDLVQEIKKDYDIAGVNRRYDVYEYMTSMSKAIVNGFSQQDYIKALGKIGLSMKSEMAMNTFNKVWSYCINNLRLEKQKPEPQIEPMPGTEYDG